MANPGTLVEYDGHFSLTSTFINGGLGGMIIITLFLIALLVAAWKAPRWVKEIGNFALVFGLMTPLFPLYQFFSTLQQVAWDRGEGVNGLFRLDIPRGSFRGEGHFDSCHLWNDDIPHFSCREDCSETPLVDYPQ